MSHPRVLVATCGNCTAADDSFGPRVGRRLREGPIDGVEVAELDIKPTALLDRLPGPEILVLVDAVKMPNRANGGRSAAERLVQIDLRNEELPALMNDDALSSHGLGLANQLELAREIGLLPEEVWLIGVELDDVRPETPPSEWMAETVAEACRRIAGIAENGNGAAPPPGT